MNPPKYRTRAERSPLSEAVLNVSLARGKRCHFSAARVHCSNLTTSPDPWRPTHRPEEGTGSRRLRNRADSDTRRSPVCWSRRHRHGNALTGTRPHLCQERATSFSTSNNSACYRNISPTIIISVSCHLADAFIQRDLQLIRLSRRHTPLEQCGVKGLAQGPNSCADLIVATPGIEPPTLRVQVK